MIPLISPCYHQCSSYNWYLRNPESLFPSTPLIPPCCHGYPGYSNVLVTSLIPLLQLIPLLPMILITLDTLVTIDALATINFLSLSSVIVRVSVLLKRTVGDSDWRFDNLSGSHLQSQSNIVSSVDTMTIQYYTILLWLWRWLPLRLSKLQSLSPRVLFRTTLTRTITIDKLLTLLGSNHLLCYYQFPCYLPYPIYSSYYYPWSNSLIPSLPLLPMIPLLLLIPWIPLLLLIPWISLLLLIP